MFPLVTAVLLCATPDAALAKAKAHLDKSALDDVLFTLQGVTLEGPHKTQGADLLAQAAQKARATKDDFLALQFAQMALGHVPAHPAALETAARASLQQEQFAAAEAYADRWMAAAPARDDTARYFRAQLALDQGDAQTAVEVLRDATSPKAKALRTKAKAEVAAREASLAELAKIEAAVERGAERAQAAQAVRQREEARQQKRSEVILYSLAGCGFCDGARNLLRARKVPFIEKDIGVDDDARAELARKRSERGLRNGGVPAIEVRGIWVEGFDRPRLEEAIARTK